jgi:heat shock protein HtpX
VNASRGLRQTLLLLGGMGALLLVLGYTLAGGIGAIAAAGFGLSFLWLTPRMPVDNMMRLLRARPLAPGALPDVQDALARLVAKAGLQAAPRLYYVASPTLNAMTVGGVEESAIAITDGLLRTLDRRELVAVLAHELSHVSRNDMRVMTLASLISRVTAVFASAGRLLLLFYIPLFLAGVEAVPWLAVLVLLAAPIVASLLQLALSRTRELDADAGAVDLTGDPHGLASALTKMERVQRSFFDRMFFPGRSPLLPSVLLTHPRTRERVEKLLALEA